MHKQPFNYEEELASLSVSLKHRRADYSFETVLTFCGYNFSFH